MSLNEMAEENGAPSTYLRFQGFHGKYLSAEDDCVSVSQDRDGTSISSVWRIEQAGLHRVKLKSCHGFYLTASEIPCLADTGKKVLQTRPPKPDCSSIEWELVQVDETTIKLRVNQSANFLQSNTSLPPWRGSVTHDNSFPEWILWKVEAVESPPPKLQARTPALSDGRIVFYMVVETESELNHASHWHYLFFRGRDPDKLAKKLRKQIDAVENKSIAVCIRHPANQSKLYPLHLDLPPGTAPIYLVVLKSRV